MKKSLTTVAMALAFTFSILAIGACAKSPSDEADGNGTAAEDSVGTGETPGSGENEGSGEQTGDGESDNGAENGGDTGNEEETAPEPEDNYEYYITCKRDGVNIRSGAGTEHSVIGTAEKGTTYVLRGKVGNWYKTYYKNQTAYINASYFDVFSIEKSENDAVEEVLEKGYATLGVPYVYGAVRLHDGYGNFLKGFTTSKFDCSSLVQYVFYEGAQVVLQTTTRLQSVQGTYVPRSELSRGDSIYFTNAVRQNYTGVERIGHVAIYLGDNYILHTATDYARIEPISAKRWSYYIETRRFV